MASRLPWLISSKLHPGTRSSDYFLRSALGQIPESEEEGQLILMHAPAGYGKTVVASHWYLNATHGGRKAAWLSLDELDADPTQFLCYLIAAFHSISCGQDYELPPHPQTLASSSVEVAARAIVSTLARNPVPEFIFIDDFHRAENEATSMIIRCLLEELQFTKLVLISRSYPRAIAPASLRSHGKLTEVTYKDLAFSTEDAVDYLGDLISEDQRYDYCVELAERTEGWPTAMRLIRQLIANDESVEGALSQASGESRMLNEYFLEQVFEKLTQPQKSLLLKTANLERINGDLADAICDTSNAWVVLEELESNDVFLHYCDPSRQWLRVHRLFAEFLADRAHRIGVIDNLQVARKASDWFRSNEYPTEALHYALKTTNSEFIAETLESINGYRMAVLGNLLGVKKALSLVPDEICKKYPRTWLADIFVKLKLGQLEVADHEFRELRRTHAKVIAADSRLVCEIEIFDALVMAYCDHDPQIDNHIARLLSLDAALPHDDHFLHGTRQNILCGLYLRKSEFDMAIAAGEASAHHYQQIGSLYGEIFIYYDLAIIFYRQGRFRDASTILREGMDLANSHFGAHSDIYVIGTVYKALFSYDQGHREKADEYIQLSMPRVEQCDAWIEVFEAAYNVAFQLAASKGDWEEVEHIRQRAILVATHRQLPRISKFVDVCYADLLLRYNRQVIPSLANACPTPGDETLLDFGGFHIVCFYGRSLLRDEKYSEAASFFEYHAGFARKRQLIRTFLTLSLLSAIAFRAVGDLDSSARHFDDCVSYAVFEDIKRPIIDEGSVIIDLVEDIEQLALRLRKNRLRDSFLAKVLVEIKADLQQTREGDDLLSGRERDVMRILIRGLTNKEIADSLGVSENTVKFHLKNIFQKIGVVSRHEASRVAMRTGLL